MGNSSEAATWTSRATSQAWTHPAGFTITNSINPAQEITAITSSLVDATHPQYLAQNITYTPWGAESTLENGCAGSGCTNTVESYAYNNRLQPVMIELGTMANAAANNCLVYNYYAGVGNPTGCAVPSQGTGDNGNVRGYLYQDSVNSSLGHAASYSYDSLNRLTNAAATGSSTYNFTFQYDRWGNMTCMINGQTNGPCPEYSFNSANNRITNTGYTYDATGDLTSDGTNTYQYDAEGRLLNVNQSSAASWSYNALGDRTGESAPWVTADVLFTPSGQLLSYWDRTYNDWGFERFWLGGRMMAYYNPDAGTVRLEHVNGLGSASMVTDQTGALVTDQLFYPWGTFWQGQDTEDPTFADLLGDDRTEGLYPAKFREYSANFNRWMSPDPLGGDITNPQSLNRYAYALNNPTTLTDPLGLNACSVTYNPDGSVATNCTVTAQAPPPIPPSQYPGCVAYGSEGCIQPPCGELPGVVGCGGIIYTTSYGASGGGSASASTPAPPSLISPAPPQTPTWLLQTKVFVSALGNNFINEFKPNGCFAQFANELAGTDGSPPGVAPEDMIRTVGQAGAMSYAMAKGLSYPLKSSIYRGILAETETVAGVVTLVPTIYEEGKALNNERKSFEAGICQ